MNTAAPIETRRFVPARSRPPLSVGAEAPGVGRAEPWWPRLGGLLAERPEVPRCEGSGSPERRGARRCCSQGKGRLCETAAVRSNQRCRSDRWFIKDLGGCSRAFGISSPCRGRGARNGTRGDRMRRARVFLIVLLGALVACGGGGDDVLLHRRRADVCRAAWSHGG